MDNQKKNIISLSIVALILAIILLFLMQITHKESIIKDKNPNKILEITEDTIKNPYYNPSYQDRYIEYQTKNPDLEEEKVITYVNIGLDQEFYTNIKRTDYVDTTYLIVNKFHYLDKNYEPEDLEKVDDKYTTKEVYLRKEAKKALIDLIKQAKKEGYTIKGYSGYRSYNYQKKIYNNYSKLDGVEKADTYSARAGFSEHQTGLAIDVNNNVKDYTEFGSTKEFEWMEENAHKFGFILRYTKENEWITGYQNEPWHYRYVGVEIATYIHENPITYEEYYVKFIEYKKN